MAAKENKLKARLPRGLADRDQRDIRATETMVAAIRRVYERYGFEPVETPAIEYTEALGKFLPDQDRPNEGVFSFQDDDEAWLSLRYDLTAPLARYVAENYERLPKPYRSYRFGWVFRNEKPGPGRFRQFLQFDADTVGASSPAADAEMCMMAADTMEALGIPRGRYVIKVNSRKVLDGVMEAIGLGGDDNAHRRLTVLRAIDKLDRLGIEGVRDLLGAGRKDESGDFTKGAGLGDSQVDRVLSMFDMDQHIASHERTIATSMATSGKVAELDDPRTVQNIRASSTLGLLESWFNDAGVDNSGVVQLASLWEVIDRAAYNDGRVRIDPGVVRGLEYYTGPVFEAELLAEIPNEKGQPVVFGSVGGGGRYDGLVGRFMKDALPATGFSIGVSRLQAALAALGKLDTGAAAGPVVVTVMDRARIGDYQAMVSKLRAAKLEWPDGTPVGAELYLGESGMKAQLKYADRRNAPLAIIQGSDEKARGVVQIKDLAVGKAAAAELAGHDAWKAERPGQFEVAETELVAAVRRALGREG